MTLTTPPLVDEERERRRLVTVLPTVAAKLRELGLTTSAHVCDRARALIEQDGKRLAKWRDHAPAGWDEYRAALSSLSPRFAEAVRRSLHAQGWSIASRVRPEAIREVTRAINDALAAATPPVVSVHKGDWDTLQERVHPWVLACFGPEIASDKIERNHRFLEEALELVQACGCGPGEAHQLVDYVYGREQGEINQEIGGVMITLAALCLANGFDMHEAGETELARTWTKIDKIRAKQAAKPRGSVLPIAPSYPSAAAPVPDVREDTAETGGRT